MSYQVAFDICDNATQDFTNKVISSLPTLPSEAAADPNEMEVDEQDSLLKKSNSSNSPLAKLHLILSGKIRVALDLEFLFRNNNTDIQIMRNTKVRNI
jgi:26S proteasome regulatory subunit N2